MTSIFRDQVSYVSEWFLSWNECEQVVMLYSLLRKITSTQARFLLQVIEHILQNCSDSDIQEGYANDPDYICNLCKESKEFAVSQLLKCLPLLKVGNVKAKAEYLNIMPKIMAHSVENGCHIEECRQLLSYSLIHPAISRDELALLTVWMNSLEDCNGSAGSGISKAPKPPLPSQNLLLSSQFGSSCSGDGVSTLVSVHDKNNLMSVPNGISSRYVINPIAEKSCSSNDWPTITSLNRGGGGGDLSGDQGGTGVIGSRNRILTSSASVPLSDGSLSHPFITWSARTPVEQLQLPSQTPYSAVQTSQANVRKSGGHQKLTRTASLVPQPSVPVPSVSDWLSHIHGNPADSVCGGNIGGCRMNQVFVNLDQLHAPLSPQSSITSSGSGGSDTHQDDLHRTRDTVVKNDMAMKDVSIWLKTLRLHKYSYLFQQITYDEMMNLTEDWLEGQGVTKGARNKIIISIRKLKERPDILRSMEKDVMGNGNLKQAISDLRQLLNTPIKYHTPEGGGTPSSTSSSSSSSSSAKKDEDVVSLGIRPNYGQENLSPEASSSSDHMNAVNEGDSIADGDIPGQMTRVLGKICTQLLVTIRPDCDCLINYQQLLDRCINHPAFTVDQKRKMTSWRQQIHRVWQFLLQKQNIDRHRPSFNTNVQSNAVLRGSHNRQVRRTPGPSWTFGGAGSTSSRSAVTVQQSLAGGHPVLSPQGSAPQCPNPSSFTPVFSSRPTIEVSPVKQQLGRTQSAPIKTVPLAMPLVSSPVVETPENSLANEDIHASLDSLCISMMEHALGN